MTTAQQDSSTKATAKQLQEVEELIAKALKKVGGKKENDICRYLPMSTGGYMHHFTLRKMKTQGPEELSKLINKHILNSTAPKTVAPKARAARGSRKRRDQITFSKTELDHMLRVARQAGDTELIRKLTPKKDLKTLKRELIASIRRETLNPELWASYCEVIEARNTVSELSAAMENNPFGNKN